MQQTLAHRALKDLQQHSSWSAGSGLCGYGTGLKPEYVSEKPQRTIMAESNALFQFDPVVKENAWVGAMRPPQPCSIRCHGLCGQDVAWPLALKATKNMYTVMKSNKVLEKAPLLISFEVAESGSEASFYFFTRFFGTGDVALLVQSSSVQVGASSVHVLAGVEASCVVCTSHLAFHRVLKAASEKKECQVSDFRIVKLTCFESVSFDGSDGYAVEVLRPCLEADLSLAVERKAAKRSDVAQLPFGLSLAHRSVADDFIDKRLRTEKSGGDDSDALSADDLDLELEMREVEEEGLVDDEDSAGEASIDKSVEEKDLAFVIYL